MKTALEIDCHNSNQSQGEEHETSARPWKFLTLFVALADRPRLWLKVEKIFISQQRVRGTQAAPLTELLLQATLFNEKPTVAVTRVVEPVRSGGTIHVQSLMVSYTCETTAQSTPRGGGDGLTKEYAA